MAIRIMPKPEMMDAKPISNGLFLALPTNGRNRMKHIWLISFPEYTQAISADLTPNCFSMVDNTTVKYENIILWDTPKRINTKMNIWCDKNFCSHDGLHENNPHALSWTSSISCEAAIVYEFFSSLSKSNRAIIRLLFWENLIILWYKLNIYFLYRDSLPQYGDRFSLTLKWKITLLISH